MADNRPRNDGDGRPDPTPAEILESIRNVMSESSDRRWIQPERNDRESSASTPTEAADADVLELTDEYAFDGDNDHASPLIDGEARSVEQPSDDRQVPPDAWTSDWTTEAVLTRLATVFAGEGGRSVPESLKQAVNEAMEPLVREWMDANLPDIVEQVVGREIRRLIRVARKEDMAADSDGEGH